VLLGKSDRYVVVRTGRGDTLAAFAERFLGDPGRAWMIAEENDVRSLRPGQVIVIPLRDTNRVGVFIDGYQTVPILTYHRFGRHANKLTITPDAFAEQLQYLRDHDYRVIPLHDLAGFVDGKRGLPRRSVVITIDDGYQSAYKIAFPILRKFGVPATILIYSDYIGHGGLTWSQMKEMLASGLVTIQAHSKTHRNLTDRSGASTGGASESWFDEELRVPHGVLSKGLDEAVFAYAYPYGDFDDRVLAGMEAYGYTLGLTVMPGVNPAFAPPLLIRRFLVFGDRDLSRFAALLKTFQPIHPE